MLWLVSLPTEWVRRDVLLLMHCLPHISALYDLLLTSLAAVHL